MLFCKFVENISFWDWFAFSAIIFSKRIILYSGHFCTTLLQIESDSMRHLLIPETGDTETLLPVPFLTHPRFQSIISTTKTWHRHLTVVDYFWILHFGTVSRQTRLYINYFIREPVNE